MLFVSKPYMDDHAVNLSALKARDIFPGGVPHPILTLIQTITSTHYQVVQLLNDFGFRGPEGKVNARNAASFALSAVEAAVVSQWLTTLRKTRGLFSVAIIHDELLISRTIDKRTTEK